MDAVEFKRIINDAHRSWDSLSIDQKQEKQHVLAALKRKCLPDGYSFEFIPRHLKGDRDVLLAMLKWIGSDVKLEKHFHQVLAEHTHDWRNDREFVLALCKGMKGALAMNVTDNLKEDEEVVRVACANDGDNLEHCGPMIRQKIVSDRAFMLSIVSKGRAGKMLALAPDALRKDEELLTEAVRHGLPLDDIPEEYKEDRTLLREAITYDCLLYLKLGAALRSDPVLSSAAVISSSSTPSHWARQQVIHEAFKLTPGIYRDRQVIWEATPPTTLEGCQEGNAVFQFCHESLRNDRELAVRFIKHSKDVYEHLDEVLKRDPEVITSFLDSPWLLRQIPPECLLEHPELVIRAVNQRSSPMPMDKFDVGTVPLQLFRRLDITQAYADNGGIVWDRGFPKDHCDNHDLCLSFLKGLGGGEATTLLDWISDDLYSEKCFMLEALSANFMCARGLLGKFQREVID